MRGRFNGDTMENSCYIRTPIIPSIPILRDGAQPKLEQLRGSKGLPQSGKGQTPDVKRINQASSHNAKHPLMTKMPSTCLGSDKKQGLADVR